MSANLIQSHSPSFTSKLSGPQAISTSPLSADQMVQPSDMVRPKAQNKRRVFVIDGELGAMPSMGKRIAAARKLKGFTQRQLAEKIGVSPGMVAQYEQDMVKDIGNLTMLKIIEVLEVSGRWISYGTPPMNPAEYVTLEESDLLHTYRELSPEAQDKLREKAHEWHEIAGPKARTRAHPVSARKKV